MIRIVYRNSSGFIQTFFVLLLSQQSVQSLQAQQGIIRYRQVWNLSGQPFNRTAQATPAFLYFERDKSLYFYNRSADTSSSEATSDLEHPYSKIGFKDSDPYGNMFFKDHISRQLRIRQLVMGNAYISEEPLPAINWILSDGERTIGIFNCKKATALFRGRNYTAWYTMEIPVREGPWKLHGLPGLILETYDQNKEIHFIADSIAIPAEPTNHLVFPENGKKLPFHIFKSMEYIQSARLLDSLKTRLPLYDGNQISLKYSPIEIFDD